MCYYHITIAKPPFTKPPFVNSRCSRERAPEHALLRAADAPGQEQCVHLGAYPPPLGALIRVALGESGGRAQMPRLHTKVCGMTRANIRKLGRWVKSMTLVIGAFFRVVCYVVIISYMLRHELVCLTRHCVN